MTIQENPVSPQKRRRVTIKEVAERAGVSPATVSYVLGGRKEGGSPGSMETRRRVRQAAEELGYRPNRAARGARTGRSGTILIAASHLEDPWVAAVIRAVEIEARSNGMTPLVLPSDDWYEIALSIPMDAIFVTMPDLGQDAEGRLKKLVALGSKVIAFSDHLQPRGYDVIANSADDAAREAAAHFARSHDRVFLASIDEFSPDDIGSSRRAAFLQECERRDVEPIVVQGALDDVVDQLAASGAQAAVSDTVGAAVSLYFEAIRRNFAIPDELEILALGNLSGAISRWAPLSYVGAPGIFERMAEIIVRRAKGTAPEPTRYEFLNQVVHQGTTHRG